MHAPTKRCHRCGTVKPYYEFGFHAGRTDGLDSYCSPCGLAFVQAYQSTPEGRANVLVREAKRRATKRGLVFTLDKREAEIAAMIRKGCALTGLEFDISSGTGRKPNSPSIDRVKPELGYTVENVRVICWALNSFLGEWGEDVVAPIAEAFLKNRRTKT